MIALTQPKLAIERPPNTGGLPDHLSPSSIKEYLTCPRKYYFSRILKIAKPVPVGMHLGKAVHAAIRRFNLAVWRGGDASKGAVIAGYETAYRSLEKDEGPVAFVDDGERHTSLETGRRMVGAFLDSACADTGERPLGVEVRVEEHFDGIPVPLVGYIDLVRPGNVPVDYKTVGSTPNPDNEAWGHQIQLAAYQLMTESATGAPVTGLELVFLVKTKTPKVIRHTLAPAGRSCIARFREILNAVVDGLEQERFHPQPGMHCNWCPFRVECANNLREGGTPCPN